MIRRAVVLALVAVSLGELTAPAAHAQGAGSVVDRLGGVEPPDPTALAANPEDFEELLTEQGLSLDIESGVISARGGTLHDARSLGYPIEYLMVTDRGRTHEALFVMKAQPSVLDACFRALGLQPGHSMRWVMKDPQPPREAVEAGEMSPWEAVPGSGPLVSVDVAWTDDNGMPRSQSLESMLLDVRTGEPVPDLDWIYTGSGIAPLRQGRRIVQAFMADLQGNVIAIYLSGMGAAVLERNSIEGVDDSLYTINSETAPARKTPVTLVFRVTGQDAPPGPPPSGVEAVQGEEGARLDAWLIRAREAGFGGVVLVARGDEIVLHKGYGLADRERNVPMSTRTVFPLGTMSRSFLEDAILQLEAAGELKRSDRIARYLDDVSESKSRISIANLLDDASGFPDGASGLGGQPSLDAAVADILALPLGEAGPDERGEPNRLNGTLLAGVVEAAASVSWGDYLADHVFAPADMTDSGLLGEPRWGGSQLAASYASGEVRPSPATSVLLWPGNGHGALVASVRDLFRWQRAVRAGDSIGAPPKAYTSGRGVHGFEVGRWVHDELTILVATNSAPLEVGPQLADVMAGKHVPLPPR
jgi:CubicO group peptidase (beta-lactamase class C family)